MDDEVAERPRGKRWRLVAQGLGELLVTGGLVVLLFVVYELFITDLFTAQAQNELTQQIHEQWAAPPPDRPEVPGDAIAVLYIPRLGEDYRRVVLEGTAEEQLSQGPGHYPGTAMPGEQGNVALAGHRVGKGSPFLDLDQLQPGDPIVLETRDSWFVYRMLPLTGDPSGIPGQEIVLPTATEVISPVPGEAADAAPAGAYLTLTTCHPRFSARQRLVVHAVLDGGPIDKTDAPDGPPALREGAAG
jgi:LPXTG-site transpeptidase (sortase) family protein